MINTRRITLSFIWLCLGTLLMGNAVARELQVLVGWTKPPYVIERGNTGFEIELTRSILTELGHTMNPVYVPFGRTPRMVEAGQGDVGLTLSVRHNIAPELLSDVYVVYQNVVITLEERNIVINDFADLRNHTIIAFQTATNVLGAEYSEAVANHEGYLEIPEQLRQTAMLLLGSVDAVVMDRHIFNYFRSQFSEGQRKPVILHQLFPVSPYRAGIRDPQLRSDFNRTLGLMQADGRYQLLLDRFQLTNLLDRLPTADGDQ